MATVWHGLDCGLSIPVAIKILNQPLTLDRSLRVRFQQEAQTMARLRHPNIVEIKNLGEEDGRPYIVMELIEGRSLSDHIARHGPLPPKLAVQAIHALLGALAFAHEGGVIHRDIKPANILISHGPAFKLTDFGIARPVEDPAERRMTRTNVTMGTWGFMAPEQSHSARDVDTRADIYAAGATLFSLLTGQDPVDLFIAEHDASILEPVPPPLREIIRSATFYHPEKRYPDAASMQIALEEHLKSFPDAPEYPLPKPTAQPGPATELGLVQTGTGRTATQHSVQPTATAIPVTELPLDIGAIDTEAELDFTLDTTWGRNRRSWWPLALVAVLIGAVFVGWRAYTPPQREVPQESSSLTTPVPTPTEPETEVPAEPTKEVEDAVAAENVEVAENVEAVPKPAAPAPRAPAAEPAPARTQVSVTGDAESVTLVSAGGTRHRAGRLPAGRYTIVADFGFGEATAGQVTLSGQGRLTVNCDSAFATCTPR